MRWYTIPKWLRIRYPDAIWDFFLDQEKTIYLTFDDGPNPETTPWILETLKEFDALATFFCLGIQASQHPDLINQISESGHTLGNHGMHHLDGFKTSLETYVNNTEQAGEIIPSSLFRPPYGRIRGKQYRELKSRGYVIVFWSLMAYDFDPRLSSTKRIKEVLNRTRPGTVLVLHDSQKALPQLKTELPLLLRQWKNEGYQFKAIRL